MPVFNGEHLLERALQSILKQSFANFEIIILDNLSTDSTPLICKRLAEQDPRINYVLDSQHRTTHEAANYLMGMARREYCISACDDDLWEPELLEVLVNLIEANPHETNSVAAIPCQLFSFDHRIINSFSPKFIDRLQAPCRTISDSFRIIGGPACSAVGGIMTSLF